MKHVNVLQSIHLRTPTAQTNLGQTVEQHASHLVGILFKSGPLRPTFLIRLFYLLHDVRAFLSLQCYRCIIPWMPEGRASVFAKRRCEELV